MRAIAGGILIGYENPSGYLLFSVVKAGEAAQRTDSSDLSLFPIFGV